MAFEQLTLTLILAGISGFVISGLAALGNKEGTNWDWKKFVYSVGVAVISALTVIGTGGIEINENTVISIFLAIVGTSFLGNKAVSIATKLKGE